MYGRHNVQNALAAIAVADEMDIDDDVLRAALAGFEGVKRRFTRTGEVGGITVIDDYGHHPVEIAAVLRGRPRRPVRARSSPWSSRIATAACATCSRSSAPASTMPTR